MADHAAAGAHSPEEFKAHAKKYLVVGMCLYALTIVTVAVAWHPLPVGQAIALALAIATTKATLVALFFMHLIDEKRLIRWTLLLTASFFVLVLALPSSTTFEGVGDQTELSQKRTEKALTPHEGAVHEGVAPAEGAEHK